MRSQTTRAAFFTGLFLMTAGFVHAAPPEWAMNDGVRSSGPPGLVNNGVSNYSRVQAVPIPATTLILFGAGLIAMPWLRARRER